MHQVGVPPRTRLLCASGLRAGPNSVGSVRRLQLGDQHQTVESAGRGVFGEVYSKFQGVASLSHTNNVFPMMAMSAISPDRPVSCRVVFASFVYLSLHVFLFLNHRNKEPRNLCSHNRISHPRSVLRPVVSYDSIEYDDAGFTRKWTPPEDTRSAYHWIEPLSSRRILLRASD